MSLITDFQDWINTTFYRNDRRLITGTHANTLGHKCIENFAVKDEAFPKYVTTIQDIDLDGNNEIIINHQLNTNLPKLVFYDENGYQVNITQYAIVVADDADNIILTFFDEIPITGVGYYTLIALKFIESVTAPYTLSFYDRFDLSWDLTEGAGGEYYYTPNGWTILPEETLDGVNYYLENTTEGCLIHDVDQGTIILQNAWLETGTRFRIEIETTAAMIITVNTDTFNADGVHVFEFISTGGYFEIKLNGVTEGTIKYINVYEY